VLLGPLTKAAPLIKIISCQTVELHFDTAVPRLIIHCELRNFLCLPEHLDQGEINYPVCFKVRWGARLVLGDAVSNLSKKSADRPEQPRPLK